MMIHLHTEHNDEFKVLMHYRVKGWCLDAIRGDEESWNVYDIGIQIDASVTKLIWLIELHIVYPVVHILCFNFLIF